MVRKIKLKLKRPTQYIFQLFPKETWQILISFVWHESSLTPKYAKEISFDIYIVHFLLGYRDALNSNTFFKVPLLIKMSGQRGWVIGDSKIVYIYRTVTVAAQIADVFFQTVFFLQIM